MSRARVVLPLPLSPTTAVIVGGASSIASEKPSSATVGLARFNNPPPKVLVTCRTASSGGIRPSRREFRRSEGLVQVARDLSIRARLAQLGLFDLAAFEGE